MLKFAVAAIGTSSDLEESADNHSGAVVVDDKKVEAVQNVARYTLVETSCNIWWQAGLARWDGSD